MNTGSGLLAIVLLGGVGPAALPQEDDRIEYRIRFVETADALDLQEELYGRLRPVARQGGATVWTIDQKLAREFLVFFQQQTSSNIVQAPKLTCEAGATGNVRKNDVDGRFEAGTQRCPAGADEPKEAPGCPTKAGQVRCGNRLTIKGKQTDKGVLAHLTIEDTRVASVHKVTVATRYETVPIEDVPGITYTERKETRVPVPEVIGARVEGEWLIPEGKSLLVSLGVYTVADGGGKAVVRDRLVMIEAEPVVRDPDVARAAGRVPKAE